VPVNETTAAAARAATASPFASAFGPAPATAVLPPTANFASAAEIERLPGVSRELAERIVRARGAGPIEGLADLKRRANLTETEWNRLKDHLIVL